MKRKRLIVFGVLAVAGLVVWFQRFDIALDHVRSRVGQPGPAPASFAWSIVGDFADRPELESFVRERLAALAEAARAAQMASMFDPTPLLHLTGQVYASQPERVDAAVVSDALVVECLKGCSISGGYADPPKLVTAWSAEAQTTDAFRNGMRSAAMALPMYPSVAWSWSRSQSYAALVTTLAAGVTNPDDEVAGAVAAFVIGVNPEPDDLRWLSAALERFAGTQGVGAAWAAALSKAPAADPSETIWNTVVETLRGAPALSDDTLADAVVSHCARRSQSPKAVDEACIDLGRTWGDAWVSRLRRMAGADRPDADAVRALLAAHERERTRSWQRVLADWREAPAATSGTTSAWQYERSLERPRERDTARLLAAGPPVFPAVAALYRTSRNPAIINDAVFVLSEGSPRLLSSALIDSIERFRMLPPPLSENDGEADLGSGPDDDLRADGVDDAIEARRVAAGLLALEGEGKASTRIHPLILALSIPRSEFSKHASSALRQALDANEFAAALFGFLAIRERYLVSEVDIYGDALVSYEGVGLAVERNLAQLLSDARSVPERVPWILKVIGVTALGEVGGSSARPLLEQYAEDTGSYLEINSRSDAPLGKEMRHFADLAACGLESIDSRNGNVNPHGDFGQARARCRGSARVNAGNE